MKVAEAHDLEADLQRMRDENAELRRRLNETASLEVAKKKADARVEQLEEKVRVLLLTLSVGMTLTGSRRWRR